MPEDRLSDLGLTPRSGGDVTVTSLVLDSRQVAAGTLFAALPGTRVHGAEFIQYALRMGVAAVLTDRAGADIAPDIPDGVALVVVEDAPAALARAAALFYGAQPDVMVAVTGTNGKTSVASFTRQIWEALDFGAVNIGTTGVEGAFDAPGIHTTPDAVTLHKVLYNMVAENVSHAAMEASSHGLDQKRMDGVDLAAAAFTNLTQDHLDYHGDMETYFQAKLRLFLDLLPDDGVAVVNLDDAYGTRVAEICDARGVEVMGVAQYTDAALKITGRRIDETGQDVLFSWQDKVQQVRLNLIGAFQAMNVLTAAGLVIGAGEGAEAVCAVLP